jgi:hypothetical protein
VLQPPQPAPWEQPAGHVTSPQLLAVGHEAMQLHESSQVMSPHALVPVHWTAHARSSQAISPQAFVPVHVIVHFGTPGPSQSTSPHALIPMQLIVHSLESPQCTRSHAFGAVHEIMHV